MPDPTPGDALDLMAECVGIMQRIHAEGGRLPCLVDLDDPDMVNRLGEVIDNEAFLRDTSVGTIASGDLATAVLAELRKAAGGTHE
ncbi:MAG: hypothetical protein ACRDQA_22710 [Nocardioidaceae bacterium]